MNMHLGVSVCVYMDEYIYVSAICMYVCMNMCECIRCTRMLMSVRVTFYM